MISKLTTAVFAIVLTVLSMNEGHAAEPVVRSKTNERPSNTRTEKRKLRRQKSKSNLDSKQAAAKTQQPTDKSAPRYQMLSAGQRVVVLDTHTGETKVIEPHTRPAYQNVEVGKAWVVVTVLGNVSERTGSPDDE